MDKLQPLIRHHFWICFVLALIFAMTGWWKANAKITEDIEARSKSVADSFANATKGADAPNKSWSDAAQLLNLSDRKKYEAASKLLWERQKAVRLFDPEIREKMAGIKYMDPIPKIATRGEWGILYEKMFRNVLEVVKPFKHEDGSGLVVFDETRVTHMPFNTWGLRAPSSDEIWKLQEDMWLLRSLLTSLSRVNDGSRRLTESPLREIVQLRLRGGQRDAPLPPIAVAGNAGFGGGGGNAPRSEDGEDVVSAIGGFGGNAGVAGGVAGQRNGPWTAYELPSTADFMTEEFGAPAGILAMGGGGNGRGNAPDPEDTVTGFVPMIGGAFGAGAGTGMESDRYVDEDAALPYKTRAFFLQVKIKESEIPRLLAELTDSSFPVEIVRLDVTSANGPAAPGGMFTGGSGNNRSGRRSEDDEDVGGGLMSGLSGLGGLQMMAAGGGGNAPQAMLGGGTPGLRVDPRKPVDNSPAARAKAAKAAQVAQQTLAAAMMDPSLVTLRVGGLMTLYQTKDEADAQSTNEAAAQQEGGPAAVPQQPAADAGAAAPTSDAPKSSGPAAAPADGAPGSGETPPAAAEGSSAPADPTATPQDPAATPPADPASAGPANGENKGPSSDTGQPVTEDNIKGTGDASESGTVNDGKVSTGEPDAGEPSEESEPADADQSSNPPADGSNGGGGASEPLESGGSAEGAGNKDQ